MPSSSSQQMNFRRLWRFSVSSPLWKIVLRLFSRITKDLFSRRRENRDEISWISKELLRPFSIILLKENLGSSSTGRKFSCFANFALWKKETKDEDQESNKVLLEVVVICFHSCCSPKDFEKGIEKLLFKSMIHSKGFRKASIKNKSFWPFSNSV